MGFRDGAPPLLALYSAALAHSLPCPTSAPKLPIREMISPMVATLSSILERGQRAGLFRSNIDPLRLYVALSGLGYYIVSNRFTLEASLGRDFSSPGERAEMVRMNTELLLAYLMRKYRPAASNLPGILAGQRSVLAVTLRWARASASFRDCARE